MVADRASRYSLTNMVLAIGVVIGIVVVFVVLTPRPHYNSVREIDPAQAITAARRVAPYPVLAPVGLPASWRATSATVTGPDAKRIVQLHIGYVSPKGAYVALEESNAPATPFIELQSTHGRLMGQIVIDGISWDERFSSNQKQYAIDRTDANGVTIVITGNSVSKQNPYDELKALASSLG